MKRRSIVIVAAVVAYMFSVAGPASKNRSTIQLTKPTAVGSTVLAPGDGFADELGSLLIFRRLCIQPSAGSSLWSRAEIQQDAILIRVVVDACIATYQDLCLLYRDVGDQNILSRLQISAIISLR